MWEYYYEPATQTLLNLTLMHLIDEEYTAHPFAGRRRMTIYLHQQGYTVNELCVETICAT